MCPVPLGLARTWVAQRRSNRTGSRLLHGSFLWSCNDAAAAAPASFPSMIGALSFGFAPRSLVCSCMCHFPGSPSAKHTRSALFSPEATTELAMFWNSWNSPPARVGLVRLPRAPPAGAAVALARFRLLVPPPPSPPRPLFLLLLLLLLLPAASAPSHPPPPTPPPLPRLRLLAQPHGPSHPPRPHTQSLRPRARRQASRRQRAPRARGRQQTARRRFPSPSVSIETYILSGRETPPQKKKHF